LLAIAAIFSPRDEACAERFTLESELSWQARGARWRYAAERCCALR